MKLYSTNSVDLNDFSINQIEYFFNIINEDGFLNGILEPY